MQKKADIEDKDQAVSPRQWASVLVSYLLLPLSLFASAGAVSWWQAWLYSVLLLLAGLGGRIWAEQRHPGLIAKRQNKENFRRAKSWDKILAPMMAVSIAFPMMIVAGLDHRYHWSPDFPLQLNILGFFFIVSGYAYAAWALVENRFFYAVVCIQTDRGHELCDSGPYRFVRHPGYAGNILALLGLVLALASLWALVPTTIALIITLTRTALEDKALINELPGYREYTQKVRYRLIPGLY